MAQNSEQIESKLCAYIEGELDERGRAEIEKHLQANPHHRKLLAELGETRRMMQALPRESAPPELYEAFQSQLERSVLLDYNDGRDEPAVYRINRFPQVFAAAAIVMLAVGLGLIVYFALPMTPTRTVVVSDGPSLATAPVAGDSAVPPPTPDEGDPRRGGSDVARKAEAFASTTPATQGGSSFEGVAGIDPLMPKTITPAPGTTLPADAPSLPVVAEQLRGVAGGGSNRGLFTSATKFGENASSEPLVVVVSAMDPVTADSTLRRALARIPEATWADATPALLSPAADADGADAEKLKQLQQTELTAAEPTPAVRTRMLQQATDVLRRRPAGRADKASAAAADELPAVSAKSFRRERAESVSQGQAETTLGGNPTTAPAKGQDRNASSGVGVDGADPATAGTRPAQRPAPAGPNAVGGTTDASNEAKTEVAKGDEWALKGAVKESTTDSPTLLADAHPNVASESEQLHAPAASAPALTPAAANEAVPAAPAEVDRPTPTDGGRPATLTGAYRVIVAQNVSRSQLEALRRELGDESAAIREVAVYDTKSDQVKTVSSRALESLSVAATNAAAPAAEDDPPAPAPAGELAKQGNDADFGGFNHEAKKPAGPLEPMVAAPAAPATPAPAATTAPAAPERLDASKDRTVRIGDMLRVRVASAESGKPPVEQDVRVAEDGTLTIPQAAETVYSDGLTVAELERHLETTLARENAPAPVTSVPAPAGGGARAAQPAARTAATPRVTIATVSALAALPQTGQMPVQSQPQPSAKSAEAAPPLAAAKPAAPPASAPVDPTAAQAVAATTPARGYGADALHATLDDEPRVEVVFVVQQAKAFLPLATSGVAAVGTIENSEILTVTVGDPANPTTTNLRVAEDGTIDVPLAGKLKAVGKSTAQLESDIEARWRESKASIAPGAKAKVARPIDDAAAPAIDAKQ